MSSTAETPGPVCENGHAIPSGASRCTECGGRLRMQWMTDDAAAARLKRSLPAEALIWLVAGLLGIVLGAAICMAALNADLRVVPVGESEQLVMSSGAKVALVMGALTSTMGVLATLVAVTAKGVQLGDRAT